MGTSGLSSRFLRERLAELLLMGALRCVPVGYRPAWFMEYLATNLAVALIVRSKWPLIRSLLGRLGWA